MPLTLREKQTAPHPGNWENLGKALAKSRQIGYITFCLSFDIWTRNAPREGNFQVGCLNKHPPSEGGPGWSTCFPLPALFSHPSINLKGGTVR
jgi:hypothetical protein